MPEDLLVAETNRFKAFVLDRGWRVLEEYPIEHGVRFVISDGVDKAIVSIYSTGKVLAQGKKSCLIAAISEYAGHSGAFSSQSGCEPIPGIPNVSTLKGIPRIGIDESGKGDYFGPLVVSAVYLDPKVETHLRLLGVCDSKQLSDHKVVVLSQEIQRFTPYATVVIGPKRYNDLYAEIRNLNRILAWGHARALENVLEKVQCDLAVSDQFGDEAFLRSALMERGRAIRLVQHSHAEQDIAVAAASIVARAAFLKHLDKLSHQMGMTLPKGSSDRNIVQIARRIVAEGGLQNLAAVAKVHFGITKTILGGPEQREDNS